LSSTKKIVGEIIFFYAIYTYPILSYPRTYHGGPPTAVLSF